MTTMKKAGFDLDDFKWEFNVELIPFMNETLGTSVTYETHHSFDFSEVYGIPNQEALVHVERFCHDWRLHGKIQPTPGALRGMNELKNDYLLPSVTSRCESIRSQTEELAYVHGFHNMIESITFTNATTRRPEYQHQKLKKSEVCLREGIGVFGDDALHNALDIASVGIPVLLLDRPWNQAKLPHNVIRVGNWREGRSGWDEIPGLVRSILG